MPAQTLFPAARIELVGAGSDGQFGTSDDTTAETVTTEFGEYSFEDLVAGDFRVTVVDLLVEEAGSELLDLCNLVNWTAWVWNPISLVTSVTLAPGDAASVDFGATNETYWEQPSSCIAN